MRHIAPRVVVDDKIRFGKLVIKGTRVPADLVVGKLAGGMAIADVMVEYDLTKPDVLAALRLRSGRRRRRWNARCELGTLSPR
jgi:uncharacterized protein (DUF433 family)